MKIPVTVALVAATAFGQNPTKVDYLEQLKNQPYLTSDNNVKYTTLTEACTAASQAGVILAVGRRWTMDTATIACDLQFVKGGMLVPIVGATVTLTGTLSAPPIQIFDLSQGGAVVFTKAPVSGIPEWWGAAGDNTADDTRAIQNAANALCGAPVAAPVNFLSKVYKVVGTITLTTNRSGCVFQGTGGWNSELRHTPAAPNTDMIVVPSTVAYSTWNQILDLKLTTTTANTRYLVSVSNNSKLTVAGNRFSTVGAGRAVNFLRVTGMLGSWINNNEFVGPTTGGSGDCLFLGANGANTTTTVTIAQNTFVNCGTSGGSSMNLQGSAGAASILVQDNILENASYGAKTSTAVNFINNHFEANPVSDILTTSSSLLYADGNNFQHATSTPYLDMTGNGEMYWGSNITDLAAGKTLAYIPAGAHFYPVGGTLLPNTVFPEGIINSGSLTAMAPGVLGANSFTSTGVVGDFRAQLFRGNRNFVTVAGVTALHVVGGNVGGATPVGLPAGEKLYFDLINTNGSAVSTSSSIAGDFTILGAINSNGLAGGTQQLVELTADGLGNLVVTSSGGWVSTSPGTRLPNVGLSGVWTPVVACGGSSAGVAYASRYADYYVNGNAVIANLNVTLSGNCTTPGQVSISGLPYANGSAVSAGNALVTYYSNMAVLISAITGGIDPAATAIRLYKQGSSTTVSLANTDLTAASQIVLTVVYTK